VRTKTDKHTESCTVQYMLWCGVCLSVCHTGVLGALSLWTVVYKHQTRNIISLGDRRDRGR